MKDLMTFGTSEPRPWGTPSNPAEDYSDWRGPVKVLHKNRFTCYIHGDLEDDMGFDIPILLCGTVPRLQFSDIHECIAIVNGKAIDALFVVGLDLVIEGRLRVHIVKKTDLTSIASNSEVKFK